MTQNDIEKRFAQINARQPEQLTAEEAAHLAEAEGMDDGSIVSLEELKNAAAHMREEYDFSQARKNPYAAKLKRQITINIDGSTIDYFKEQSAASGIPYQSLINLYLRDCAANNRQLHISWQ